MKSLLKQDLKAVRAVVAKGWTQGALARNADGYITGFSQEDAVCWCIVGAMYKVTGLGEQRRSNMEASLYAAAGCVWPASYNDKDHRTQEEVLALIDKAIDAA